MILVGLTAATAAWAEESRDFTVRNRTGYRITGFWFSFIGLDQWVAMAGNTIGPGEARDVHFDNTGPCNLQFRIQTSAGTYAAFMQPFNFCTLSAVTIYYDPEGRVFTADPD